MNRWTKLFTRPTDIELGHWFAQIADQLLNRTHLAIANEPHRLTEIEFYFHSHDHPDPFTHFNPIQAETGRWYFHRTGGAYRGGSFKGIDMTFGDGRSRAGILIRGLATPRGQFISGPSLLVDYLLSKTRLARVADLDAIIGKRRIWDRTGPVRIVESAPTCKPIVACARVGLSLKRAAPGKDWPDFLLKPYRFLTEPSTTRKGKAQLAIALVRIGNPIEEISRTTGCPKRIVQRYVGEYTAGRDCGRFEDYFGKAISPVEVCRLHGIADRLWKPPITPCSSSPLVRDKS